jgi:drug/metabolite transporter (DMT)-like permease
MDTNTAAAIAGSVIGVMGGVIGTCFSVVNTSRPRERALMIRLAALVWLSLAAALIAWLFVVPQPWKPLASFVGVPLSLAIPWMNRRLARARAEDASGG